MRQSALQCFVLTLFFLFLQQSAKLQGNSEITGLIEKGQTCLKERDTNCRELFIEAINAARQTNNDSLIGHTYLNISTAYTPGLDPHNYKLDFAREGMAFAKVHKLPILQLKFYGQLKQSYKNMDDATMAHLYGDSTLLFARSLKDTANLCQTLMDIAVDKRNLGNYNEAFKLLLEAKDLAVLFGDKNAINTVHSNLATAYGMNGDFEECVEYSEKGMEGYFLDGDSMRAMYALTNWCNAKSELGKPEEVLDKLPIAINYFSKHAPHITMYAGAQLGKAFNELQRMNEAIPVLKQALKDASHYGNSQHEAFIQILLSESYRTLGDYDEALDYSTKAYNFHKDREYSVEHLTTLFKHSQALIKNNKYKEAVDILQDLQQAKDSVFEETKMKEIARIQQELEFEKKENMICAQVSEISILQKEKEVINNRNIALIVGLLLAFIIGWLLVKRKSILVRLKQVENQNLNVELNSKRRELTSQALHLAQKNELLNQLKSDLRSIKNSGSTEGINEITDMIRFDERINNNWEQFTRAFTETNAKFFKTLSIKHTEVGKSDLRLAALISMNLGSKEIANILNISIDGVKKARYRLRKKLNLNPDQSLRTYLAGI